LAQEITTARRPAKDPPRTSGCNGLRVRQEYRFSEWDEIDEHVISGQPQMRWGIVTRYYPPPASRPLPPWTDQLLRADKVLWEILREVHSNLRNAACITATAGTRILLDRVMVLSVGDVGGFDRKLQAMLDEWWPGCSCPQNRSRGPAPAGFRQQPQATPFYWPYCCVSTIAAEAD
jgi:hypothetical protein